MTFHVPEKYRFQQAGHPLNSSGADGNNGVFFIPRRNDSPLRTIVSDGEGWEHVSVSLTTRCPTWEEMCQIKEAFWDEEDCVIQFHPPKSEYVNHHPYCLHLWRPTGEQIKTPPSFMIGPKS